MDIFVVKNLSHLYDMHLSETILADIKPQWQKFLTPEFEKHYFQETLNQLQNPTQRREPFYIVGHITIVIALRIISGIVYG